MAELSRPLVRGPGHGACGRVSVRLARGALGAGGAAQTAAHSQVQISTAAVHVQDALYTVCTHPPNLQRAFFFSAPYTIYFVSLGCFSHAPRAAGGLAAADALYRAVHARLP